MSLSNPAHQKTLEISLFFFVQTKMSWRNPLTSQYSRQPLGIEVQSFSVLQWSHNGCGSGSYTRSGQPGDVIWHTRTHVHCRHPHHTLTTPSPNPHHTPTTPSPHPHHTLTTPSPHPHPTLTQPSPHPHHTLTTPHHTLTTPSPHPRPTLTQPSPHPHHNLTTPSP